LLASIYYTNIERHTYTLKYHPQTSSTNLKWLWTLWRYLSLSIKAYISLASREINTPNSLYIVSHSDAYTRRDYENDIKSFLYTTHRIHNNGTHTNTLDFIPRTVHHRYKRNIYTHTRTMSIWMGVRLRTVQIHNNGRMQRDNDI
jgi:hypothetical protein